MKNLLVGFCALVLSQELCAQDFLQKNEYYFSYSNGLKQLIIEDTRTPEVTVGILFNFGAFLEDDNFDGLSFLYEKILAGRLKKNLKDAVREYAADSSLFSISSETSYEYVFLSVSSPKNQLNVMLESLFSSVAAPVDSAEVARAVALSNRTVQRLKDDPWLKLDTAVGTVLWEDNFSKRNYILEWNDSSVASLPARLGIMKEQYICSGNSFLLIKGNIKGKEVYQSSKKIFDRWAKCTINSFGHFPGYNFKLILTNSQLVLEDSTVKTPFYEIALQGAPTFEGAKNSYCASIFGDLLANPNSKIHQYLKDSCHLALVHTENDLTRSFSQLTFTVSPDSGYLGEGIECFRAFLTGANDSLIDTVDLKTEKTNFITKFKNIQSDNREHLFLIGRFWKTLSLDDYSTFEDSVHAITMEDMQNYIDKYLHQRHWVAGLCISPAERTASKIDSIFTPTATTITAYEFHFLKNSAHFASAADDSVFNSLVQYLKLNPDVKIKVNGVCHESELLEISDEDLSDWVRSLDHFIINPPSLVGNKKFRLDVYRSLTLIKKLTESGIEMSRLLGTGNLVRSPEEPEKYQTANCSLSSN